VIGFLCSEKSARYLDCTGGGGGHSAMILGTLHEDGELWIGDYHPPTVATLKKKFLDKRVHVLQARFSLIFDNLVPPFHGILADFGISSMQLDDPTLGIGFSIDAPLDMRLDNDPNALSASDLLKTKSETELADIFYYYGGEHASRKLALAIVSDRKQKKFYETTTELKLLCERVLGRFYRHKKIHPATKIFQALRIAVNGELQEVETFLQRAPEFLATNGRLVVISFHEGEDRLVKNKFKELEASGRFKRITRKAVQPTDLEIKKNPRSRSARLRVLEKIG